jgi:hypothetical protein
MIRNLLCIFIFISFGTNAQPVEDNIPEDRREEIEAMKVAFLTRRMELTPKESQKFWPVYNQYQGELDAHRREGRKIKTQARRVADPTIEELDDLSARRFAHERERIDIEEKYYEEFKKVLPPRKIAVYYVTEQAFKRELLRRLQERRNTPIPEGNQR